MLVRKCIPLASRKIDTFHGLAISIGSTKGDASLYWQGDGR